MERKYTFCTELQFFCSELQKDCSALLCSKPVSVQSFCHAYDIIRFRVQLGTNLHTHGFVIILKVTSLSIFNCCISSSLNKFDNHYRYIIIIVVITL